MKAKKLLEYKLKGKRNVSSRKPLIIGDKIIVVFIFDHQGFVASSITCFNMHSFEVIWEYSYPFVINNIIKSLTDNVFACCMDGKLLELNRENGELINSIDLEMKRCGQSSAIVNNKLIVGGIQGTATTSCFDLNSGQKIWTFNTGGHSYNPLIAKDNVYQCTEKNIRCLELKSGSLIWEAHEENTYIFNPVMFKDLIVVGGHGLINFYNSKNGKLTHQIHTNVREAIRAIISEEDNIYFGDSSGIFYAYRISTGKNILGQIKTNSEKLWSYTSNGAVESIPAITEDKIMFINNDNKLICLDKTSGDQKWNFNTKGEAGISGVLVEDEYIYTSVGKGFLYKLIEE